MTPSNLFCAVCAAICLVCTALTYISIGIFQRMIERMKKIGYSKWGDGSEGSTGSEDKNE